jgi:hypothetical protein
MVDGVARELGAMSGGLDAEGRRAVVGATRLLAAAEMTAAHARLLTVFRCPGEADDEAAADKVRERELRREGTWGPKAAPADVAAGLSGVSQAVAPVPPGSSVGVHL